MPIETKIEGNPGSIRDAGRWLRASLSEGVHDATTQVHAARSHTEADWTGPAAEAFRGKMAEGGKKADQIAQDADRTGRAFETYADALQTAQTRMERVRQAAGASGLKVTDSQILEPGPAPQSPGSLPDDATPQEQTQHATAVKAQDAHAKQVKAFNEAKTEASGIREAWDNAVSVVNGAIQEVKDKPVFQATALADATIAATIGAKVQSRLTRDARILDGLVREGQLPGQVHRGEPHSNTGRAMRNAKTGTSTAAKLGKRALWFARLGSKIPLIGTGLNIGVTAWDIAHGKPPGKAIFSAVTGQFTSGLAGAGVGALVGSTFPGAGTAAGVVTGGVVGSVVGLGSSSASDWLWDHGPKSITKPIDNGLTAGGKAIGNGAKKAWNSIF